MLDFAIVVFSFIVATAIHECGHAIAGVLLGFRIDAFGVWPVFLYRSRDSWHFSWALRFWKRGFLGFVGLYPVRSDWLRVRTAAMIFAGPLFSIASAIAFGSAAEIWKRRSPHSMTDLLGCLASWSLLGSIQLVLPVVNSDGRRILNLLLDQTQPHRRNAITALTDAASHLHPREWDPGLVSFALDRSPVAADLQSTVKWLGYNWYADTGNTKMARKYLNWLLSPKARDSDRWSAQWEAVWFEIFSNNNLRSAREQMEIAKQLPDNPQAQSMIWKARAALAAGEGRQGEAQHAAAQAIRALDRETAACPGLTRAIKNDLDELLKRYAPARS